MTDRDIKPANCPRCGRPTATREQQFALIRADEPDDQVCYETGRPVCEAYAEAVHAPRK